MRGKLEWKPLRRSLPHVTSSALKHAPKAPAPIALMIFQRPLIRLLPFNMSCWTADGQSSPERGHSRDWSAPHRARHAFRKLRSWALLTLGLALYRSVCADRHHFLPNWCHSEAELSRTTASSPTVSPFPGRPSLRSEARQLPRSGLFESNWHRSCSEG